MEKFNRLLEISAKGLHQNTLTLLKSLTKLKEYVFKFLFEPDVPYDNNASERAVRVLKVKQKVSGMFKTDTDADTFSQIQSIAKTAKKNNQNPFLAILAVANNH